MSVVSKARIRKPASPVKNERINKARLLARQMLVRACRMLSRREIISVLRTTFTVSLAADLVLAAKASAQCPVCTVAAGTGVGLSRWLGIDDAITGLWLGGLVVSLAVWSLDWMDLKGFRFRGYRIVIPAAYYLSVLGPLYYAGIIGHPSNALWGLDKIVLGTAIGSGLFYLGIWWYKRIKLKHKGHAYFPFQKVVMPVAPLIAASLLFYYFLK
jgi:hypothetical protein